MLDADGAVLLRSRNTNQHPGATPAPPAHQPMPLPGGETSDQTAVDQMVTWLIEQGDRTFAPLRMPERDAPDDLQAAKRRRLLAPGEASLSFQPGGTAAFAAAGNPPAASLELRRQPHTAKGNNTVNLNERVTLPGETPDSYGGTTIECRHLAVAFATHAGRKSDLVDHFATRGDLTKAFTGRLASLDSEFNRLVRETPPSNKHLVRGEQFGTYLSAVAGALEQAGATGGPNRADTLLSTADHVMALEVQRKTRQGQPYYAVKVYDPNATANYIEVEAQTPQELSNLRFEDLLIRRDLAKTYAPPGSALTLAAIGLEPRLNLNLAPLQAVAPSHQPHLPDANEILLALSMGMPDQMRAMGQKLKAQGAALSPAELFKRLEAKDEEETPALFLAMQDGHTGAINAFGEVLKSLRSLSGAEKAQLLAAKDADGQSALQAALAYNKIDSAKAGCALFAMLDVDPRHALGILQSLALDPRLSDEAAAFLKQAINDQNQRLAMANAPIHGQPGSPVSAAE